MDKIAEEPSPTSPTITTNFNYKETNSNKFLNGCKKFAFKALETAEMIGGKFADFFGLSDSRYQYVLDEYLEQQEQERRNLAAEDVNISETESV